jgi:hypothetical protein
VPEVPTPRLVALLAALDAVPAEDVPHWAAHWLIAGHDGDALRALAGLSGTDPGEARDELPDALADCGVTIPAAGVAAAALSFTHLARMLADGRAGSRWVAQKAAEIVADSPADAVAGLPLARLTDDSDDAEVALACADHLATWG